MMKDLKIYSSKDFRGMVCSIYTVEKGVCGEEIF